MQKLFRPSSVKLLNAKHASTEFLWLEFASPMVNPVFMGLLGPSLGRESPLCTTKASLSVSLFFKELMSVLLVYILYSLWLFVVRGFVSLVDRLPLSPNKDLVACLE